MTVMDRFSLEGEVALITGGRRGIGRAIALAFAEAGADIAVADVVADSGELDAVVREVQALGRNALAVGVDTAIKTEVDAMVDLVTREFGKIDILVNNAGIFIRSSVMDISEEDWDRLFDVDLKSFLLCAQAAGRHMIERRKGNIINLGTQWALKTGPGMGPYGVAKAGVIHLTRALARELSPYNIRANTIAPGMVKTDFSKAVWSDPQVLAQLEAAIPLGRAAEADDLVGTALFLASPASAYITGNIIIADGGGLA
jgi:2-deoxy-D-gluconate 3-dehydrogenase